VRRIAGPRCLFAVNQWLKALPEWTMFTLGTDAQLFSGAS
jgi:hypothetical protein